MAVLFSDDFNRTGSTLGNGWTETGPGATNMSTDGSFAQVDTNPVWHLALAPGTASADHYIQSWLRAPASTINLGLVWRYLSSNEFYFLTIQPGGGNGIRVFKRKDLGAGVVNTLIGGPVDGTLITTTNWHRIALTHVGNVIHVYLDNLYLVSGALDGPRLVITDSSQPIVGSGQSGITSTSQSASGASGPRWNDFKASDGEPEVIYVDTAFNGGVAGEGMGTEERPDTNIDFGLSNAGCVRGSTVRVSSAVAIGNTVTNQFSIGHQGKFGGAFTFPTYSPDNGQVIDPGSPNLTIESDDGQRVTLREVSNVGTGGNFFEIGSDATGIVFRGFDVELPDPSSNTVSTTIDAPNDHSVHFAKCMISGTDPLQSNLHAIRTSNAGMVRVEAHYCYFKFGQGTHNYFFDLALRVQQFVAEFCIFQGREQASIGQVSAAINVATLADPQLGDAWRINHCHFVHIFRNLFNAACFSVLDAAGFQAVVEFKNNLLRGSDITFSTEYGVYTGGNSLGAGGAINCHHNGYFRVDTPRDVGATDGGNEILTDPAFNDASSPFEWQHTQGGGVNGEGTFLPMTLDGDYRPTNPDYLDTADDSSPLLGVLDRGALQNYTLPGDGPAGGGSDVAPSSSDLYCVSVIYDRGGPNETDLSSRLMQTRPLRQEKDILLRQYKASDTALQFRDPDGIFIEINAGSFLRGSDGRSNWLGKPVDVYVTQGGATLVHYKGFVINAQAARGVGFLQLANRLQRIFDRLPFANSMGRVVSTTSSPGMGDAFVGLALLAPASGAYLTRVTLHHQAPFDANQAPFVETLRFSFLSGGVGAQFSCTGSLTGPKGTGFVNAPFTASDGSFSILDPTDWEHEDLIVAGQECTLNLVWRPTAGLSVIDSLLEFLLDEHVCDLDAGDLDMASFDSFRGTIADQPVAQVNPPVPGVPKSRLVVDEAQPLLKYMLEFALHVGSALIERADGRLALNSLVPRVVDSGELPTLCKSDDLMELAVDHIDVYNVYAFSYNRSETLDRYQSGGRWPPTFNESFDKYQRLLPAPQQMEFRGFDESARSWIEVIAQSIYIRYRDPARVYAGKVKLERMDMDLDSVFRIDSEGPTFEGPVVEPFVIDRNATGDLTVSASFLEVSVLTEECGAFLWYDNPNMGYDDECWAYF